MQKLPSNFPIVGVGASAGGLDSFQKFLSGVENDSGIAYVFIQHLDPSHKSLLPDIFSRKTNLSVQEIVDGITISPDTVYILPPNSEASLNLDLSLTLKTRNNESPHLPIDVFFTSLAEVLGEKAIGIILSGTANDGTLGLKLIRDNGGLTLVEKPDTAAFSGMPQSAIDANVVDFIVNPTKMAEKVKSLMGYHEQNELILKDKLPRKEEKAYLKILSLIQLYSGVDLHYYKQATIRRRLTRRMAINQINSTAEYLVYLRENTREQEILFQDMLIHVTSFFRDKTIFEELADSVFPKIIENSSQNESIRIWIPGCSTGEEAYSLAIILQEVLEKLGGETTKKAKKIQIFASDLSIIAIEKARAGIYGEAEVGFISDERLKKYFTKVNGNYKVNESIRDTIIFAIHNFLKDPPFAKLDLISCRNVFIYLDSYLQKKALTTFHYALRNHGFLILGKAETSGAASELYTPYSSYERIYIRKKGKGHFIPSPLKKHMIENKNEDSKSTIVMPRPDFKKAAESVLLSKHTPPSVIVDEQMDIVHINGSLVPFLQPPVGKPTFNLMKMAQEGLGFELRNALHKAKTSQQAYFKEGIPIMFKNERILGSIEVIPLLDTVEQHYLILFYKKSSKIAPLKNLFKKWKNLGFNTKKSELEKEVISLRNELALAREDMRSITEDQETTNEELQSANEEMLSSNEEMQSLNEELETSKEELQSTNEELIIINQELLEKQNQLNDYLHYNESILATLRESLVVLDKNLRVRNANSAFCTKFGIEESGISGKSFLKIMDEKWANPNFKTMLEQVLPQKISVVDFEMEFNVTPTKKLLLQLNAREILR